MGIKTSLISILTAAAFGGSVFAAASVRSIGGAGSFASTSSASSAAAESSSRAGSLRVGGYARPTASVSNNSASNAPAATSSGTATLGTATTGSVATGGTTGARVASTPRLSVGKYVGAPVSISTKGKTTDDLDLRIDKLERDVAELEVEKQDMLDGSEYITVDQDENEVLLDLDKVRTALQLDDGVIVDVDAQNDEGIKARYLGIDDELNGKWQTLITWDELKAKLNLGGMNDAINESISGLRNYVDAELAKKVSIAQGKGYAGRVMQVNVDGNVEPGNYVYSTSEVYNKDQIDEIVSRTNIEALGDLAYLNKITDAEVAEDAAIERRKLAKSVTDVLDWIQWWNDNVPKGPDGEPDGHSYVLSVDQDGNRAWFRVVVDNDETGDSVIEQRE